MAAPRPPTSGRSWTVGQLSRASGVSIRVLHHWEEKRILTADRSVSGHRRYPPEQVTRLFRALALRRTGLRLDAVAELLDRPAAAVDVLRAHLRDLDHDLARRSVVRDRIATAIDSLVPTGVGRGDEAIDVPPDVLMNVIGAMTMFQQYVHGYDAVESQRLSDQAATLTELLLHDTGYPSGACVLEIGCGVGAQTAEVVRRSPGARLTCVDVSSTSLRQAQERAAAAGLRDVRFAQADVMDLPEAQGPLAAGTFDHVFVCFLLEHLADPGRALANLRDMLRPGGTITVIEGDHGSTSFHPDNAAGRAVVACQVELQRLAGGDAFIGRRLYPLLTGSGFRDVLVSPRQAYVDASRPGLVDGFIRRTFTAMVEGIREPAVAAGLIAPDRFDEGIAALLRTTEADGVFTYTFFKAVGIAGDPG